MIHMVFSHVSPGDTPVPVPLTYTLKQGSSIAIADNRELAMVSVSQNPRERDSGSFILHSYIDIHFLQYYMYLHLCGFDLHGFTVEY